MTFGFTGQQQAATTSWATPSFSSHNNYYNSGSSTYRPTFGFGNSSTTTTSTAPMAGFGGFSGTGQYGLTTPLNHASSATPFAPPLFGNPSLANNNNAAGAFSPAGITPFSHQHPFEPSRGFAWNMKSFEQGVTGLSNYETPASSSWAPQSRNYPAGYGLSNWGRWNGVSPDYSFNRPADVGRSLLGQWTQPSTLFRHSVTPQMQQQQAGEETNNR
jgi:hypothetical protein